MNPIGCGYTGSGASNTAHGPPALRRATAFVGYTACAIQHTPQDLVYRPVSIQSLEAYESLFGTCPALEYPTLAIDENNQVRIASDSGPSTLYDSVRLFFGNGGQNAVIVSVGVPTDRCIHVRFEALQQGTTLAFEHPETETLLVPAAGWLPLEQQASLYANILSHCHQTHEHFALLEPARNDPKGFRLLPHLPPIGREFAAMIVPAVQWMEASPLDFLQLPPPLTRSEQIIPWSDHLLNPFAKEEMSTFLALNADRQRIQEACPPRALNAFSLRDEFQRRYRHCQDVPAIEPSQIHDLFELIQSLARVFDAWVSPPAFTCHRLERIVETALDTTLRFAFAGLISTEYTYSRAMQRRGLQYNPVWTHGSLPKSPWWSDSLTQALAEASNTESNLEDAPYIARGVLDHLAQVFVSCTQVLDQVDARLTADQLASHERLLQTCPVYRESMRVLLDASSEISASGAVAGLLARNDRENVCGRKPSNTRLVGIRALRANHNVGGTTGLNLEIAWDSTVTSLEFDAAGTVHVSSLKTLASHDSPYLDAATRRTANWIHALIRTETAWVHFEPIREELRFTLRNQVTQLLELLWEQGVFAGARPLDSFRVHEPVFRARAGSGSEIHRIELQVEVALRQVGSFELIHVEHALG